ncbi:Hint domain-containing protein [Paracoccus sp. PARArs4]|uniref:Hint domain-containing protein n=1 Tax=Paracoccus sp. PARArs4 TaxID=2853442 RepID=UPI0024A72E14|nr:Hint domain-containing protein [Paracoccus sp. PARArs4]
MASFSTIVPLFSFGQWTGASTVSTVGYSAGTSFTLNEPASLSLLVVNDDDGLPADSPDNLFSDGFLDTPADGSPPSTANNDQLLGSPVTLDGITYPAGSQVELEFAFTTVSGDLFWVIRINGTNVGISGPELPIPGTTYTVASSLDSQQTPYSAIPCFVTGTLIAPPRGQIAVEDLAVGDHVLNRDGAACPIRWIGRRDLPEAEIAAEPNLRPIRIARGALGQGLPSQDLMVSPQHRVLVRSGIARRMFGTDEVLVAAKSLVGLKGVEVCADGPAPSYVHILFDDHQIILSNGAPTESLFTGAEALKAVGTAARAEILALFPQLAETGFQPLPAAPIPSGSRQRGLIARHIRNGRPLLG